MIDGTTIFLRIASAIVCFTFHFVGLEVPRTASRIVRASSVHSSRFVSVHSSINFFSELTEFAIADLSRFPAALRHREGSLSQ
jgi:hypothetical protein